MTAPKIPAADLPELIKLQFCMVAQTAAELFAAKGSTQPFKVSAVIDGKKIVAVVGVEA